MHQNCLRHVVIIPQHQKLNPADSGLEFRFNKKSRHFSVSLLIFNASFRMSSVYNELNEANNNVQ